MRSFNVMAIFCEDIREEKDNVLTLVGMMPDNVIVEAIPSEIGTTEISQRVLSKLCIYLRINFDPDFELNISAIRIVLPDNTTASGGEVNLELLRKAKTEAKTGGNALAGVIQRIVLGGFRAPDNGSIKLEVDINGETYLAGALAFKTK
jgi:hypothetical protein